MVAGMPSARQRSMVRRRVESQMNSRITIRRGTTNVLDPATGLVSGMSDGRTIYMGKARVRLVSPAGSVASPNPIEMRQAIISIPIGSAVPHTDDMVTLIVTNRDSDGSEADTNLDARNFRVVEVDGGGYFGDARRMTCTSWFPSRTWAGTS